MLPSYDVERIAEFNETLNVVQNAVLGAHVSTRPGTCDEPPIRRADSQSCDVVPLISDEAKRHLSWSEEILLGRILRPDVSVARPYLQADLDEFDGCINVDSEMRSEDLGKRLSYEAMFPELFQDIGELFG